MADTIYNKQDVWPKIMADVMWVEARSYGKIMGLSLSVSLSLYIYIFSFLVSQLNVLNVDCIKYICICSQYHMA